MTRARAGLCAVVVAVLALLTAGCGVTTQSSPQALDNSTVPTVAPPTGPTAHIADIYLVKGQKLIPAQRLIADPTTLERILQSLLSGPTSIESGSGLRSALPSTVLLRGVTVQGDTAHLDLSEGLTGIDTGDQAYAIAQLVYTTTTWRGITRMQLMVEGQQVQVPRADGTLTEGPVGRSDYASLLNA